MQPYLRVYDEWVMGKRKTKPVVLGRPATGRKTKHVSVRLEREDKLRFVRKVRKQKLILSTLFASWLENITSRQFQRFSSKHFRPDKAYHRGKQKLKVGASVSKLAWANYNMLPEGGARSAFLRDLIRKFLKKR